ncbi:MAG: hypothetical protein GY710_23155 [Desulfobacteraceae bacterium]|nr:hypothetical protein [Desulfobacteraceae bacterium]
MDLPNQGQFTFALDQIIPDTLFSPGIGINKGYSKFLLDWIREPHGNGNNF